MWNDPKFLWLLMATFLVTTLEILSLGGVRLPPFIELPLFLTFILLIGHETLRHGVIALATLNFKNINALMVIAVIGAWSLGQYAEATVVIVLYTLAEKLEDIGIERSQSALSGLLEKMPKFVSLKDQSQPIAVEKVKVGDIVLIKPGEMIALDGVVTSGISFIDESSITGEPIPQEKFLGDIVYAGTFNRQGYLEIKTLKTAENTTFAKIKKLTFEAIEVQAPTQRFIENFSKIYTPTVILLAFLLLFIPTVIFENPFDPWLARALSLIVIACPCALVISTPISIYSAIGNASKHGALIKGGKFLETIGQIQAIALDKTRTLTLGKPIVSEVIAYGENSRQQVLECAAGIEIFSEHPLAQSIVDAAKKENLSFHQVENFKSFTGKGAKADCLVCTEKHHCLGKLPFILEEHAVPQQVIDDIEKLLKKGKTAIVIATHQEVEGVIALTDEIRPESRGLIEELKKLNITPIMLTGDHHLPAMEVAKQLGIDRVKSELLPEDKADMIKQLLNEYQIVAMVGDGINDAPALALSSVGITIDSLGSDTAIEAASIVILNDRINVIPFIIKLGRQTVQTIRFNVALAILIKLIFIVLALLGLSNLAFAIFADVGVTLIVILISIRLLNSPSR
ncbi:MAG: heavy metal translocating P-type ATPase [Parachlamydiaceae bacterium]